MLNTSSISFTSSRGFLQLEFRLKSLLHGSPCEENELNAEWLDVQGPETTVNPGPPSNSLATATINFGQISLASKPPSCRIPRVSRRLQHDFDLGAD